MVRNFGPQSLLVRAMKDEEEEEEEATFAPEAAPPVLPPEVPAAKDPMPPPPVPASRKRLRPCSTLGSEADSEAAASHSGLQDVQPAPSEIEKKAGTQEVESEVEAQVPEDSETKPEECERKETPDKSETKEVPDKSATKEVPDKSATKEVPDKSETKEVPDKSETKETQPDQAPQMASETQLEEIRPVEGVKEHTAPPGQVSAQTTQSGEAEDGNAASQGVPAASQGSLGDPKGPGLVEQEDTCTQPAAASTSAPTLAASAASGMKETPETKGALDRLDLDDADVATNTEGKKPDMKGKPEQTEKTKKEKGEKAEKKEKKRGSERAFLSPRASKRCSKDRESHCSTAVGTIRHSTIDRIGWKNEWERQTEGLGPGFLSHLFTQYFV